MDTTAAPKPYDADELKAKFPTETLRVFENEEFEIEWVVRTPKSGDFQSYRAQQSAAGDDLFPVNRAFALSHVVFPSPQEVLAKFKTEPGLVESVCKYLLKLTGSRAEFSVKKL
jgi:hypothetical protein